MTEKVNIENPNGVIRLKSDKFDSILYLNGIPIQFTWIREIGSTWRYQIAKSIEESDLILDNKFRQFVKYGYLSSDSLIRQFDYIIKTLSSGEYELKIDDLSYDLELVENVNETNEYFTYDSYGGLDDIIETQSGYNEVIINEYINIIRNGAEPIMVVLTTKNSDNRFIIDGHHKFIAYSRLKKNPRALIITKLNSDLIDKEEALNVFKVSNCKNRDYKNRYLNK
jgi:hypothetical protein